MVQDTLEVTLQYRRGDLWPVVAEHRRPGELPARSEGLLGLAPAFPDLDAFETALTERLDRPRDYGTLLGEALFQGTIRDAFVAARSGAGDGLRVLLVVEDPELRPLRWERLCAPDGLGDWDFLALDQATPYSRYLPSLTDRRFPAIGRRDLRALVVLADPPADNPYGLAPFDARTSAASIAAALGEIPHDLLDPLPGAVGPASLDALAERVTAGGYTLLHLVAHGAVRGDGETILHLLGTAGGVAPVTASELIRSLGRVGAHRGLPHLVFLAACEGAKPETEAALGGLAQRLVRDLGIPAVVAMTDRVSIATAGALAAAFYTRLRARGEPDLALVEACAALQGRGDILVPALFGRLAGRPLFSDRLDGERPLTPAEIGFGLRRLGTLLAERAPVLTEPFEAQARLLRAGLDTDTGALSPAARAERQAALDGLDALAQEALDLGFPALALDQPVPTWDGRCPFPGLKAFQRDEQTFFFGREALVGTLTGRLRAERFLAVLGASGSGKSSLVLAGVVPRFFEREQSGHADLRTLTPGADPETVLTRALAAPLPAGRDALLVVDQFEELFTLCADPGRRARFVEGLIGAWQGRPRLHVVLTMRADFWGDCAPYPALKDPMQAHQELIAPMDTGELRGAMEQQAAAVGLRFEADLSHGILAEVEGEPGAMPLLQHLLLELWRRRHGRWLRASEYRALGGIREAIAHTADGIYAGLAGDPAGQQLLRGLFVRLTRLDETESEPGQFRDTRQRVALPELTPAGSDPERLRALVQRLADARLLVTTTDPESGETQVEVSHEALIRHWPRLRGWLDEDRASWILLAAVRQQAQDWHANGERDADLPRWGERLQTAAALFEQPRFAPTETERRFVEAARLLDARERADKEAQQRERLAALEQAALASREKAEAQELAARQARGRARVAWIGTGVAATLLAVAVFLGFEANRAKGEAVQSQQAAEEQAREARHQTANVFWANAVAAREDEPLKAAHLFARSAESFDLAGRPERAANALLAQGFIINGQHLIAMIGHQDSVTSMSWSANGERIVTSSRDDSAQVWDPRTGEPVGRPMRHESGVIGAVFSPRQTEILTWGWDGTARLWDAETGNPLGRPMEHAEPVYGAMFNGDGTRVLTRSGDKTARLWDASTGEPVAPPLTHTSPVRGALFSPDGSRILTWDDEETMRLWDGTTPQHLDPPRMPGANTEATIWSQGAVFSPDGSLILAWGKRSARIWNADTRRAVSPEVEHDRNVIAGEISKDGTRVRTWTENGDSKAYVWNVQTGAPLADPVSEDDWISGVYPPLSSIPSFDGTNNRLASEVISPDRTHFLSLNRYAPRGFGLNDGTLWVWALKGETAFSPEIPIDGPVEGMEVTADFARILTWGGGQARVWGLPAGTPLGPPVGETRADWVGLLGVKGASLSGDGERILTWPSIGEASIWEVASGEKLSPPLFHVMNAKSLGLSNDGTRIIAVDGFDKAQLWNAETGEPVTPELTIDGEMGGAALSPDQTRIIAWGGKSRSLGLSFSSSPMDGDTSAPDGVVQIWNADDGTPLAPWLTLEAAPRGARFSPDQSQIVTWGDNGAQRWDARSGTELVPRFAVGSYVRGIRFSSDGKRVLTWGKTAAGLWNATTGMPLTPPLEHGGPVNGAEFDKDGNRIFTWSNDGTARLWDAATGDPLSPPLRHPPEPREASSAVLDGAFGPDGVGAVTRDEAGVVRVWSFPTDHSWPMNALDVRLAAETGTTLSEAGELRTLSPSEWRRVRHCEYDRIRHELSRIDDDAWKESERRCETARTEEDSQAGTLRSPPSMDWSGIRR